tara:strand:+ start:247 stop:489 length:243 start_codon:yes stop_codon:yes gene_type:complete
MDVTKYKVVNQDLKSKISDLLSGDVFTIPDNYDHFVVVFPHIDINTGFKYHYVCLRNFRFYATDDDNFKVEYVGVLAKDE